MSTRVYFYERITINPGAEKPYRYSGLEPDSAFNSGYLCLEEVPRVGDTLFIRGQKRVLARDWGFVAYGSQAWPYGKPEPDFGHTCNLILEAAYGPFVDEAELTDEEQDEE